MIASLNAGLVEIPGMTDQGSVYFRNLYDHLIRISDMVDAYRDLVGGTMDTHLSMVSNRLNVVMKQLAIIATIFLPLGWKLSRSRSWSSSSNVGVGSAAAPRPEQAATAANAAARQGPQQRAAAGAAAMLRVPGLVRAGARRGRRQADAFPQRRANPDPAGNGHRRRPLAGLPGTWPHSGGMTMSRGDGAAAVA
jgi:hypothetical protein